MFYLFLGLASISNVLSNALTKVYRSQIEDENIKDNIHFALMVFVAMGVYAFLAEFDLRVNFVTMGFAAVYAIVICVCVILNLHAIEKAGIANVSIFSQSGAILWSSVFGKLIFNENLTLKRVLSIICLLIVVIILFFGNRTEKKSDARGKNLCMLIFLLAGSDGLILKLYSASEAVMPEEIFFFYSNALIIPLVFFILKSRMSLKNFYEKVKKINIKTLLIVVISLVAGNVGSYFSIKAIGMADLILYSIMSPTFYVILTAVVSKVVFKEKMGLQKIISIILLIVAIVMGII